MDETLDLDRKLHLTGGYKRGCAFPELYQLMLVSTEHFKTTDLRLVEAYLNDCKAINFRKTATVGDSQELSY